MFIIFQQSKLKSTAKKEKKWKEFKKAFKILQKSSSTSAKFENGVFRNFHDLTQYTEVLFSLFSSSPSIRILVGHLILGEEEDEIKDPRIASIQDLVQTLESRFGSLKKRDKVKIALDLGCKASLKGFIFLDSSLDLSKIDGYLQNSPNHCQFILKLFGETFFPPYSLYTNQVIKKIQEADSHEIGFFSVFESKCRDFNEIRLINCLKDIAKQNKVKNGDAEIYALHPKEDVLIEYALIAYPKKLTFQNNQRSRLSKIARIIELEYEIDSTLAWMMEHYFPRLQLFEKRGVLNDYPRHSEITKRIFDNSQNNLLLQPNKECSVDIQEAIKERRNLYYKIFQPLLNTLLNPDSANLSFRYEKRFGYYFLRIVVVYTTQSSLFKWRARRPGSYENYRIPLNTLALFCYSESSTRYESPLVKSRFSELCKQGGIKIEDYQIFRELRSYFYLENKVLRDNRLDLAASKDRMSFWTQEAYKNYLLIEESEESQQSSAENQNLVDEEEQDNED